MIRFYFVLFLGLFSTVAVFALAKMIDPKATRSVLKWRIDNARSRVLVITAGLVSAAIWIIIGSWL